MALVHSIADGTLAAAEISSGEKVSKQSWPKSSKMSLNVPGISRRRWLLAIHRVPKT